MNASNVNGQGNEQHIFFMNQWYTKEEWDNLDKNNL